MRRLFAINIIATCVAVIAAIAPQPACADDADDQFALATGHYVRANYQFAAEELQAFLDKYPQDGRATEARFYLGESLSQLQRFQAAADAYRQYLVGRPQGKHALVATFRVAECLYFSGDAAAEEALQAFTTAWPEDDLNDFARPYLANCIARRDEAAGVQAYREALRLQPQSPLADECRIGLARSLEATTNTTESRRILQALAAKRNSPVAPKALYFLARSYFSAEEYAAAEQSFAELLQDHPKGEWLAFAQLGLARSLLEQDRLDEAQPKFAQLTTDASVGNDAQYWLGMTHKRQQDHAAAAEILQRMATHAPQHELADDALFHAADALRVIESHNAANKLYQELLATHPSSTWRDDAHLGLATIALACDEHQALEHSLASLYDSEDTALRIQARRLLARSYFADELFAQAISELEALQALAADDDRPAYTQFLLASAYAKANQPAKAQAAFEQLDLTETSAADAAASDDALNLAAETAFALGSLHLSNEQYAAAADSLRDFLQTATAGDSRRKLAAGELAVCLIKTEVTSHNNSRPRELVETLKVWNSPEGASAGNGPADNNLALRIAESLYEAEAYDWAAEVFADTLERTKQNRASNSEFIARLRSGLGWSLQLADKPNEAAAEFERLLQSHADSPLSAEAAILLANHYESNQLWIAAQTAYRHVIEQHPQSTLRPDALLALARLFAQRQMIADAAATYEAFLTDYPANADRHKALYQAAWLAKDSGQDGKALNYFQELFATCPASPYWPDAAYRVADAQFAANNLAQAAETLAELLQHDDQRMRPYALFLQGKIAWNQQRLGEVVQAMDQLRDAFPGHELALAAGYFAADALTEQNQYNAAAQRWEQLSAEAQNNAVHSEDNWPAKIALRHVQSLAASRRWEKASALASEALTAWPEFEFNYEHHFVIGRSLATAGRLTDARDAYGEVLASPSGAKTETAAKAQLMIAETYFHQQNFDQAVREYLKVEILYGYRPWQAAGLFQAGVCYEKLGKPDRAHEQYRRLVRDFADTEYGQRAEQKLR